MGSLDLTSYQDALESVLAWLLDAEETLKAHPVISYSDLQKIKDQFHQHEVERAFQFYMLQFPGLEFSKILKS